jgi:hypothetical protein
MTNADPKWKQTPNFGNIVEFFLRDIFRSNTGNTLQGSLGMKGGGIFYELGTKADNRLSLWHGLVVPTYSLVRYWPSRSSWHGEVLRRT